jgi:hypothetical protein
MGGRKYFWEVKSSWHIRFTVSPPSMSQLSRKCEILDISQPYRPSRPVTGIALLFIINTVVDNQNAVK